MTRMAISPRLATSTLVNTGGKGTGRGERAPVAEDWHCPRLNVYGATRASRTQTVTPNPDGRGQARAGKTLEAMKLYREVTGASFEQAKAAVTVL
jgi:hypothetical protein